MNGLLPWLGNGDEGTSLLGMQSWNGGRNDGCACARLKPGANVTKMRGMAGYLRILFDVQVAGVLGAPCH